MLEFIESIARSTGAMIVQQRQPGGQLTTSFKADEELVTSADLAADKMICQAIRSRFPQHKILAEESAPDVTAQILTEQSLWIIDPIDGTVNYANGHNQVAISIAYVEDGDIHSAVVFNPFLNEMFSARKGHGAFLNGTAIHTGDRIDLRRCLIATGFPYDKSNLAPLVRQLAVVLENCADVRRLGSAALDICWVAMGRLDGFYESLSIWDYAAAQLIAIESGATFGHFKEVPAGLNPVFYSENILVANPQLFPLLQELLQRADHYSLQPSVSQF